MGKSYAIGSHEKSCAPSAGEGEGPGGEEAEDGRESWGAHAQFILTLIGYAVGLGNVWRFPYLCYRNGGGAFLIPYFLMLAFIGMPIFFMEVAFGQFSSMGPLTIWRASPIFKGIGWAMVITNTLIAIYYSVVIAWGVFYFFASMTSEPMRWETCDNSWNTPACVTTEESLDYRSQNITGDFVHNNQTFSRLEDLQSPSEQFYYNGVLRISDGIDDMGSIVWLLALALFASWVITFIVLVKGIQSLGKVVYVTSTFPYVLLTIMLIRGVTLEGASKGIEFYLVPTWERLTDVTVWSSAATQIFYSLGTCYGVLMAMSSYNKFNNNCLRDAIAIPLINCGTSFYAGFVIFSVLGFMAERKGVSVEDVAADGPGLVFVVYPEGLSQMPIAPLWSVLFFLMIMLLGFSSQFSMIECFFAAIADELPVVNSTRKFNIIFRVVFHIVFFLIALPLVTEGGFYLFNIYDVYLGGFPLLIIGFFEVSVISWCYGYKTFADDIYMMLGRKPPLYFRVMWQCLTPLILLVVVLLLSIWWDVPMLQIWGDAPPYEYPGWAHGIGWILVILPLIWIPVLFLWELCYAAKGWKIIKSSSKPTESWGPALSKNRTGKYGPGDATELVSPTHPPGTKPVIGHSNFGYVPYVADEV